MITIDGSMGEGGGQVVRTALTLSAATGRPFGIERVRAGRDRPGLRHQHLAAVRAAAEICSAEVEGAELGSETFRFRPGPVRAGDYRFAVGTAGSAVLVAQTVLAPLLTADGASSLRLEGGTHNPMAPPFDFFDGAYLPAVRSMGPDLRARLLRPGFHPAGGGRFDVRVEPVRELAALDLAERGGERERWARAIVSALPRHIAERELSIVHAMLGLRPDAMEVVELPEQEADGPGNAVMTGIRFERASEVFTGFGKKGVPAEEVAAGAARRALAWLESGAPVGPHLADQLLVPMALAGGRIVASERTNHALTQSELIPIFFDRSVAWSETSAGNWLAEVG